MDKNRSKEKQKAVYLDKTQFYLDGTPKST